MCLHVFLSIVACSGKIIRNETLCIEFSLRLGGGFLDYTLMAKCVI